MINAATAHELAHAAIADGRQVVVVIRGLNEQARAVGVFGRVIPVHIEGERVPVSYTHLDVYKRQGVYSHCSAVPASRQAHETACCLPA